MVSEFNYKDPKEWGPHFWYMMRCAAKNYPVKPNFLTQKNALKFYTSLKYQLPCETCRKHYSEILENFNIRRYLGSQDALVKWVEIVYSEVNKYKNNNDKEYVQQQIVEKEKEKEKGKEIKRENKDVIKLYRPSLRTPKCKKCGGGF